MDLIQYVLRPSSVLLQTTSAWFITHENVNFQELITKLRTDALQAKEASGTALLLNRMLNENSAIQRGRKFGAPELMGPV